MRAASALLLPLLFGLCACGESAAPLRQVSIESPASLTLSLREVPPAALHAMGLSYGLTVVQVGLVARRSGLRIGDVIYAVNDRRLHDVEDFTRLVAERPPSLGFLVRRGGTDFYVPMELAPRRPGPPSKDTLLRT
jgi:S1-C subfamily serine protease